MLLNFHLLVKYISLNARVRYFVESQSIPCKIFCPYIEIYIYDALMLLDLWADTHFKMQFLI